MKQILLIIFSVFTAIGASFANTVKMELSEAIEVHMVHAEGVPTGQSYRSKGLRLKLVNKSGSTVQLRVNQGIVFNPSDPSFQPLISAGEEMITLQPFKEGQLDIQTFCADADNKVPAGELSYSFAKVSSDTMIKLLQYVKKNVLFNELGQKGVWVLTNDHSLATVYDPAREMQSTKLVEYLSFITGQAKPDYYINYDVNETAGEAAYTPKPLSIHAKFRQDLAEPRKLTLGVFNQEGKMIQEVFSDRTFGKAEHGFSVTFKSSNVPAGNYYIRLKSGDWVLQEKMVEVK